MLSMHIIGFYAYTDTPTHARMCRLCTFGFDNNTDNFATGASSPGYNSNIRNLFMFPAVMTATAATAAVLVHHIIYVDRSGDSILERATLQSPVHRTKQNGV